MADRSRRYRGYPAGLHVAEFGILQPGKTWIAGAEIAHIIRFMQDQPMVHAADFELRSARFVTRVANAIDVDGLSEKQISAIEKIIERQGWREPPRWRPWADVIDGRYWRDNTWHAGRVYRVTVCPGADPAAVNSLIHARPAEAEAVEVYIGPLYEWSRDVNDPRLERTPAERRRGYRARYTSVCRRLVNEARERGLLIDC